MYWEETFTIKSLPQYKFRVKRISPIDMLAMTSVMDMENFKKSRENYQFVLEHIEAEYAPNSWLPVKYPNTEQYTPEEIEFNLSALFELVGWFYSNVVEKVFQKSSE